MTNAWLVIWLIGFYTVARWSVLLLQWSWSSIRNPTNRDGNSGRFGHFSGLIHDPLTGSSTKENDK